MLKRLHPHWLYHGKTSVFPWKLFFKELDYYVHKLLIMYYFIISKTYQKIGDLFCPVIFLDYCTVWKIVLCWLCSLKLYSFKFLNLLRQQKSIEYWLSDVEAHWRLKARLRCDSAFHYCIVLNCTAQWKNGCLLFGKKVSIFF